MVARLPQDRVVSIGECMIEIVPQNDRNFHI